MLERLTDARLRQPGGRRIKKQARKAEYPAQRSWTVQAAGPPSRLFARRPHIVHVGAYRGVCRLTHNVCVGRRRFKQLQHFRQEALMHLFVCDCV